MAGPKVRVVMAPGLEDAILRSGDMRDVVRGVAQLAVPLAKQLAPVDDRDLADSISADVELSDRGWVGILQATDWKAHLWELGHIHPVKGFRIHPFLRPAVERLGLKIGGPRA